MGWEWWWALTGNLWGASATQLGGGTFGPSVFVSMGWDQNTSPLGTAVVTGVPFVTFQGTSYWTGFTQALQSGTSYEVLWGLAGDHDVAHLVI